MKATQLRKGSVIIYNGAPCKVIDFHHNTPGKGRAVVQTKLRNLLTGLQTESRFNSTEDLEEADVHTFTAQYLYGDGDGYHFMNSKTYEQFTMSKEVMGDAVYYLHDDMSIEVTNFKGSPIGVNLPATVVLTVVETEPELRGATASNSPKPARTDTGLSLTVPPFIKEGEKIVVKTDDGTYISRAD